MRKKSSIFFVNFRQYSCRTLHQRTMLPSNKKIKLPFLLSEMLRAFFFRSTMKNVSIFSAFSVNIKRLWWHSRKISIFYYFTKKKKKVVTSVKFKKKLINEPLFLLLLYNLELFGKETEMLMFAILEII